MGVAGFRRGWTSVVVALGAIGAVTVVTQSANAPLVIADPTPPVPFDANGYDDSFAVAQSRDQGPVISGKAATRSSLTAAATAAGDPVRGTFGSQIVWPIIPIHAVQLPDGRVLSYGTRGNGTQTAYYEYDVWNPSTGVHSVLPNQTATDIFCSSHVLLLNGDVEIYGGDNLPTDTNTQNRDVNQFRPAQNTLVRTGSMNRLRWYSTATVLPNAEIYIQGGSGGADYPERRTSSGQFQLLTGAPTGNLSSGYPKNFVGPDGLVFGIANANMYRVNPAGNGSITSLGTFPTDNVGGTATSVMYAPGEILQVGGGPGSAASRNASIIDINGANPVVSPLPQAQFGRHWGNATVMADGRVLVSGGSAVNNAATGVAYTSEIFDPDTKSWTTGATATRMRLYHSTSLLLPDATVITMGGGTPGPETNLNAEIYYPPYLYNEDGTSAVRPTISSATTVTDPGWTISIESPEAAEISRVSLVKLGAVTHSVDMDQRFLNLPFTRSGTTLQAELPDNVNETPPGYYMIFVLDGAGVPSHAKIVRINVAGTTPPPTTTTTTTTTPPTTTTSTTTTTTTLPPTTTSTTTTTTSTTSTSTTSTSTTTTTTPVPAGPLVANGGFENGVVGWTNTAGSIARTTGYWFEGSASIEVDSTTGKDRIEQVIQTVGGRTYQLSFAQTPQPGVSSNSNRFDVFWNGSKLGHVARSGVGLTSASWQTTTYTVTGTGSDRLSFRENDRDSNGSFIDDVKLIAQ
jgi:hypothetical protein